MGGRTAANTAGHAFHRLAVGVSPVDLDAGSVHMAAAEHENDVRAAGDGVPQGIF